MAAFRREQGNRGGLIETLKALADVCLRLEDWPGAIAAAEELVALRAADAEIWAGLGDARLNVGYAPARRMRTARPWRWRPGNRCCGAIMPTV